MDEYHLHLQQFEAQRPRVQELEENLKPREVLVYKDFVNQHIHGGPDSKCNNLVFVCMWRKVVGGPLLVRKLHNLCSASSQRSADQYYVADVWRHHLETLKDDFFSQFDKIYISGDHGPHFTGADIITHFSTFFEKYSKFVHLIPLCSYHASSLHRCGHYHALLHFFREVRQISAPDPAVLIPCVQPLRPGR